MCSVIWPGRGCVLTQPSCGEKEEDGTDIELASAGVGTARLVPDHVPINRKTDVGSLQGKKGRSVYSHGLIDDFGSTGADLLRSLPALSPFFAAFTY